MVCEGAVTEPDYIRGLERRTRNATLAITIPDEQGDPKRLVEIAKEEKAKAEALAKKESDEFLRFDEAWCVCDVDDHARLPDARQMARDNGIDLVVSNPCFELWLLLHFRDPPGPESRKVMRSMLKRFMPGYAKRVEFEDLVDGLDSATERARRLDEQAETDGQPGRNPNTQMYRLTESIRKES